MSENNREKDEFSGTETTGHEWDGIKELDSPMPRWWLIVFYISIIWSVGYWWVYPAWPTLSGAGERGGTVGSAEWTQYTQLAESQAEITARRAEFQSEFDQAPFADIQQNPALFAYGIAGGRAAFGDNCATCHGTGGAGAPGYPNLNDDDWLWGGTVDDIYTTMRYGVRAANDETRFSEMPAFAEMLTADEIRQMATFVTASASGAAVSGEGATLFEDNCASCHGADLKGIREFGAPNLVDSLWLYSANEAEIAAQINKPKHGLMPAWDGRLDDTTLRQLALFVHSLGGGEE